MFVNGEPKIARPPRVILKVFNIQLAYFTLIIGRSLTTLIRRGG